MPVSYDCDQHSSIAFHAFTPLRRPVASAALIIVGPFGRMRFFLPHVDVSSFRPDLFRPVFPLPGKVGRGEGEKEERTGAPLIALKKFSPWPFINFYPNPITPSPVEATS